MYPVIFFDALRVKIRDEGTVKNKAVYLALAIQPPNGWRNLPQASWVKNYQRWSRAGEECGTKWCLSLLIQWRFAGSFTPPTSFQSLHM
jgi:putative transposase